jgi:hypothetical protein
MRGARFPSESKLRIYGIAQRKLALAREKRLDGKIGGAFLLAVA